jgi:DNA-directed RNA polymerase beta subunit
MSFITRSFHTRLLAPLAHKRLCQNLFMTNLKGRGSHFRDNGDAHTLALRPVRLRASSPLLAAPPIVAEQARRTGRAKRGGSYLYSSKLYNSLQKQNLNFVKKRTQIKLNSYKLNENLEKYIGIEYSLENFHRSNQDTCLVHKPAVYEGQWVESGDLLADCSASVGGELALGQNILIGYMPWEGYNFEDAILVSQRLVYDDLYTSIHIERYETKIQETKLGKEELTREIPDVTENSVKNLNSSGIIKIGSWVEEGDILIGKVTPVNKKNQSNYQKLLYLILEKTIASVRDSSLRAPKGIKAKVIGIQLFKKDSNFFISSSNISSKGEKLSGSPTPFFPSPRLWASENKLEKKQSSELKEEPLKNKRKILFNKNLNLIPTSLNHLNKLTMKNWILQSEANQKKSFSGPLASGNIASPFHPELLCKSKQAERESDCSPINGRDTDVLVGSKVSSRTRGLLLPFRVGGVKFISKSELNFILKFKKFNNFLTFKINYLKSKDNFNLTKNKQNSKNFLSLPLTPLEVRERVINQSNLLSSGANEANKGKRLKKLGTNPLGVKPKVLKKFSNIGTFKRYLSFLQPEIKKINKLNCQKKTNTISSIQIYLAERRRIQVGDKMAGRHGNKGIISQILPIEDLPFLPDGTPLDMVLNPLGVPSRMNVGQIYECLLGLAGKYLGENYKVFPFDEIYGAEASRTFVYSKLYNSSVKTGKRWLFNPNFPGKICLYDGRTGETFDQPITVGYSYILRLVHMVDDKMHSRATGPYSLVTQQPLRGRSKHGGQRLGEMEVWALEGYGAAFTLLEMLTIKSDDMSGRMTLWSNLILNKEISIGTPESFKVLICELQALCLDIGLFRLFPNKKLE